MACNKDNKALRAAISPPPSSRFCNYIRIQKELTVCVIPILGDLGTASRDILTRYFRGKVYVKISCRPDQLPLQLACVSWQFIEREQLSLYQAPRGFGAPHRGFPAFPAAPGSSRMCNRLIQVNNKEAI